MTIIRPVAFQTSPASPLPLVETGQLDLEEALRRLSAMIERDPRVRRVEHARRGRRAAPRFGPTTACVGS